MVVRSDFVAAGLLTLLVAASPSASRAQGNPSADSIINSLKPGAGMLGGSRGIRPTTSSAPEPAPAPMAPQPHAAAPSHGYASAPRTPSAPRPAAQAPAQTEAPSVNLTVQFGNNSAELTPAAVKTLSELGKALSSSTLATFHFRIEGHTDTVGAADANKALSERRAQAVVAFLTSRFGIDAARLEPVGMGEDGLLVQTPANTAEPRNRRVQVVNLGA